MQSQAHVAPDIDQFDPLAAYEVECQLAVLDPVCGHVCGHVFVDMRGDICVDMLS